MSPLARSVSLRRGGAFTPPVYDPPAPVDPYELGGVGSVDPTLATYPPTGAVTTGDWYVDGNAGSDSNTGESLGAAFATLERALEELQDGQRIIVREAVYAPSARFSRNTAWATGVEIFAYGDERPVIDGSNLPSGASGRILYFLSGSRREHWKGFELRHGPDRGIQIEGQHITTEDIWVHHCQREAFYAINNGSGTSDVLYLDCRAWANGDGVTTGTNAPDAFVATGDKNAGLTCKRVWAIRCGGANGGDDVFDFFGAEDSGARSCGAVGGGWYWNGLAAGDGGGFKMGGAPNSGNNLLSHSVAALCKGTGLNHNSAPKANTFLNNTSVYNRHGVIADTNAGNVLRNNLAWGSSVYDNSPGPQIESFNSWNQASATRSSRIRRRATTRWAPGAPLSARGRAE